MDFLINREPYVSEAARIIELCSEKVIVGFVAPHSISNIFYLLRKQYSIAQRKNLLTEICEIFYISTLDKPKIMSALANESFDDFEDCLQYECALEVEADYIITRNPADFLNSQVEVVLPTDFLANFKTQ
jgi:predicted nucleic acid-binding protein